jgi:hypothetical protein
MSEKAGILNEMISYNLLKGDSPKVLREMKMESIA